MSRASAQTVPSHPTHSSGPPRPTFGLALGAAGMLVFSATVPMTRIAVLEIPWDQTLAVRMAIACSASLLLVRLTPKPQPAEYPALLGTLLGVVFGFPVLMTAAMQTAPAAHGAVVVGLLPLATAAASVLVNREHPSPLFWTASAVGAALVVVFALRDGDGTQLVQADLLLFAAVVAAGIGYASGGRLAKTIGGIAAIVRANALAAPLVLLYCAFAAPNWEWQNASAKSVAAVFYLGLGSQLIGFFFWNRGLALGGISRVGQLMLLMPFFSIALAAWLLGETFSAETPLFALAVAVCVFITMKTRAQPTQLNPTLSTPDSSLSSNPAPSFPSNPNSSSLPPDSNSSPLSPDSNSSFPSESQPARQQT